MRIVAQLAHGFKAWVTSRPKLDINESITWFLLAFVWAHGLTLDELDFEFSGVFARPSSSLVVLIIILFSLLMAAMLTVEPLLPCKLRTFTKAVRHSGWYQGVRLGSVLPAFILGWLAGFNMISDAVPELSWLTTLIAYMGFGIFLVLMVRIALTPWFDPKPCKPEKD